MRMLKRLTALGVSLALVRPASAAKWASVQGVEVTGDTVLVETSGPVQYRSFLAENPLRLVVDLEDTKHGIRAKEHDGFDSQFLKGVRSAQFSTVPKMTTRVVVDLLKKVPYEIQQGNGGLEIRLAPMGSRIAADPLPGADKARLRDAPQDIALVRGSKPGVPLSHAVPVDAKQGSESARRVDGSRRRTVSYDIMENLPKAVETFDFEETEIGDVLRLMAARIGVNIIYGGDVSGSITLHLTDVPFDEAFRTILKLKGLTTVQVGANILRVVKPATLTQERSAAVPSTKIIPLNYATADVFAEEVMAIAAAEGHEVKINSNRTTNSLVVTTTPDGMIAVERLVNKLDVRPAQVLIEAKLIEVQLSKDLNMGIQWDYFQMDNGRAFGKNGVSTIGSILTPASEPVSKPFNASVQNESIPIGAAARGTGVNLPSDLAFGALTLGRVTENYFLNVTLAAAASKGKAKVLSDPKIATINNEPASINVDTQIPYTTSDVTATGVVSTSVQYLNVGIMLKVTPTVNADGRITLQINPTVSQPSATAAGVVGAPAVDTRSAKTTIMVRDGETIVIGGLISDRMVENVAKVPLLGDIPIAGWLFKKKSVTRSRQELLIFVTTKVLED